MKILAIDTSCDETSAAVVDGRRVISNVIYSQVLMHGKWGGVVPSIAKRAHADKIDFVINSALKKAAINIEDVDAIAVTYGPGLAIALEVGIATAKELAQKYSKRLIAVNHMEGHIYSNFVQNTACNPKREFNFPYLALLISGAHTEIVLFEDHLKYTVLGETRDDAAGEAFDKGARMLGFNYPGGPAIERLAAEVHNEDRYKFPRPMLRSGDLDFSFSGLKTSFLYFLKQMDEKDKVENLNYLASSFQEAIIDSLIAKMKLAMKRTGLNRWVVGGGVSVNNRLRHVVRTMAKQENAEVYFPPYKYLNFDNAAMIGVAAAYKAEKGEYVKDMSVLDRIPRLSL